MSFAITAFVSFIAGFAVSAFLGGPIGKEEAILSAAIKGELAVLERAALADARNLASHVLAFVKRMRSIL